MYHSMRSNLTHWLRLISLALILTVLVVMLASIPGALAASQRSAAQQIAPVPVFSKTFSPDTIGPGSVSTLIFTIDNVENPSAVTDLAFTDTLPAGVTVADPANTFTTCTDAILSAPDGGSAITFSDARLAAGTTCSVWVDVTSSAPGTHTNVSGDLTSSAGNSGPATADLTVDTARPGFSKSFSPDYIPFGGRSTLTFTIDNSLNESLASNLNFVDSLPVGIVIADPPNASTTCTGGVITAVSGSSMIVYSFAFWGDASVPPDSTCAVSVDVTATGTSDNVSGELIATVGQVSVSSGKASATLEVAIDDLPLVKSFLDDPVAPGDTVVLEFEIHNHNRLFSATDITFTDDLDAALSGLEAVGLPANDVCGSGSVLSGTGLLTLTGGNLPPDGSCVFNVMLQVPAGADPGSYANTTSTITGTVDGDTVNGTPAIDTLFVYPAPIFTKSFTDDPVSPGEDVTLAFTITNPTDSNMTAINFIDELTTFLPYPVSVSLPSTPCGAGSSISLINLDIDRQALSLTNGNLTGGASCMFDVTIAIPISMSSGAYPNLTETIYGTVDGVTYPGNPAYDELVIVAAPELVKSFTDDPVQPGDTVTLEFTLMHDENSPGDATAISFTDDLAVTLSGLTALDLPKNDVCGPGSQLSGSSGDTFLSFTGGSLSPAETCTFTTVLQVPADAATGSYPNATSQVTAMVSGETVSSAAASDELNVGEILFSKSFIDDPIIPGDTSVTLRFTISNLSASLDATSISFVDDLRPVLPGTGASDLRVASLPTDPCGIGSMLITSGDSYFTLSDGNLLAGETCTFDIALIVPAWVAVGRYGNTTSDLSAVLGSSSVTIDPATDFLTVQSDWLLFDKEFVDDPAPPGSTVTLEFTIRNTHPISTATDIAFADDLTGMLSGLEAVGLPVNDVCGAGSLLSGTDVISFTGGELPPGAGCTFNVTLQVPADAPFGDYPNMTSDITGLINGWNVEGAPANDELRVSYLSFDKAFTSSAVAGGTVNLNFTIDNPDPLNPAQRIAFSDDLDTVIAGLTAVSLPADGFCGPSSQLIGTDTLYLVYGYLGPDSSCTFSVTLQVPAGTTPGSYLNTTSDLIVDGDPRSHPTTAELIIDPFVSIDDVTVDEAASTADFTVSLNGVALRDVEVDYATSSGSALAGLDYTADTNMVLIPTGDLTTTVSIAILEDALYENDETFTVTLSALLNATIADGEGVGTITDNDALPLVSFDAAAYQVDETGGNATISITLNTPSGLDVMVDYATSDGTALAGNDYEAVSGTLTIPAGQSTATFLVPIISDNLNDDGEMLDLILSNPINAALGTPMTATLMIVDRGYYIYLPVIFR